VATAGRQSPGLEQAAGTRSFFEQFVIAGGPIVWFVLLPMSLVMVSLAVQYFLTIRRKILLPSAAAAELPRLSARLPAGEFVNHLSDKDDLVGTAVAAAIKAGAADWFRMRNACFESLQQQALKLMRRIEWLNLIGNVSPMVGLFGTVFGMIKLFNSIVTAGGQPQPGQLADGISVALVTTFWGLAIAIPALALYAIFRNRIEALANEAVAQLEDALPRIRRNLQKQLQPSAGRLAVEQQTDRKQATRIAELRSGSRPQRSSVPEQGASPQG